MLSTDMLQLHLTLLGGTLDPGFHLQFWELRMLFIIFAHAKQNVYESEVRLNSELGKHGD